MTNSIKAQLQNFSAENYQGALIKSATRRILEEQSSKRALSDERQAALAKEVLEIQYEGSTNSATQGMLGALYEYVAHFLPRHVAGPWHVAGEATARSSILAPSQIRRLLFGQDLSLQVAT